MGFCPKRKLNFRSNWGLIPLVVEGWVWLSSYLGKLDNKRKFQKNKLLFFYMKHNLLLIFFFF